MQKLQKRCNKVVAGDPELLAVYDGMLTGVFRELSHLNPNGK